MKKIALLLIFNFQFLIFNFSFSQPTIQWQNTIGGGFQDGLQSIQQTSDGGYILGGQSSSSISGDKTENNWDAIFHTSDIWLIKTDASGNIQWQNTIGGTDGDNLYSIQQTSDGGYILGGTSLSNISGDKTENSNGGSDYWLVKTDATGNIQLQNTIGGSGDDILHSVQQTSDGGYILGGYSDSNISGDKTENSNGGSDYWLVKTDATGNIQWQNTIGGSLDDKLYSIQQATDGGYILGGWSTSNISGDKTENCNGYWDYWIVKTDALGNIQWQNTIGGSNSDDLMSIQQTSDGGYVLGGTSQSNISGDKTENNWDTLMNSTDYWIVKTDASGNIQWQNTIGGSDRDDLWDIQQTSDGGYVLCGNSWSNLSGDKTENNWDTLMNSTDYWIVKTDAAGNIQWQNTIGGTDNDNLSSIQQTADGGYILGGDSWSNISGDKTENSMGSVDYWIIKLSPYVSIDELSGEENFISLFPNPATEELRIQNAELKIEKIELYNTVGESVFKSQVSSLKSQISVDVSQLLPGVYFVAVTNDKGNKITRKFIKL